MIRLCMVGAKGRMGTRILDIASKDHDINVTGAIETNSNPCVGELVFPGNNKYLDLKITSSLDEVLPDADVVIDFTYSKITIDNLAKISDYKVPVVIGTTGFNEKELKVINDTAKKIPVVFAPNMSIGVNVFFKLLKEASRLLKGYETEILELHHNKKKDSPSGTAVKMAEIITEETNKTRENWVYGREGMIGERPKNELGIHAVRLGDVVGEHTVYFAGNNERIELTHRAHTRDNLATGAIAAAKWVKSREIGLYDMQDVLGL